MFIVAGVIQYLFCVFVLNSIVCIYHNETICLNKDNWDIKTVIGLRDLVNQDIMLNNSKLLQEGHNSLLELNFDKHNKTTTLKCRSVLIYCWQSQQTFQNTSFTNSSLTLLIFDISSVRLEFRVICQGESQFTKTQKRNKHVILSFCSTHNLCSSSLWYVLLHH